MTTVLKGTDPLVVPLSVRRRAGMKAGDRLEFKAARGVITIVAQAPDSRDEEASEQRKIIDAQVAVGLADIRRGRLSRRFDTVEEMLASLKAPPLKGTGKSARPVKTRSR